MGQGTVKAWDLKATVDAYATLGVDWNKPEFGPFTIVIENVGGVNAAHYKVFGSIDKGVTYDIEIQEETEIPPSSKHTIRINDYYPNVRIQIKAAVAAAQTNVSARGAAYREAC